MGTRRRKLYLIVIGLPALLGILFLAGSLTFMTGREIVVRASLYDVAPQLTDLRNWRNWYPGLKDRDTAGRGSVYTVTAGNPAAVVVREEEGGAQSYQSFAATPEKDGRVTRVRWTRSLTALGWLKEQGPGGEMDRGLSDLRKFIEDPAGASGFVIAIRPVKETLILTAKALVLRAGVETERRRLLEVLRKYAADKKVVREGSSSYTTCRDIAQDSTEVAVGLPVRTRGPEADGVSYLELPAGGRLLTGSYKGSYSLMKKLYGVMDKYAAAEGLRKAAAPFEIRPDGGRDEGSYELDYPIY